MTITADADAWVIELAKALSDFGLGDAVTIRKRSSGAYDPTSGQATVTTTDYTTRGKLLGYRDGVVDGNLVKVGDRRLIMTSATRLWSPSVYFPVVSDVVFTGTTTRWNVQSVKPIMLQGVEVACIAQLRGSNG